jgi:cytochrome c-type protein NapC
MSMSFPHDPFSWLAIGGAAMAAPILLWFLSRRPPLVRSTKVLLLLGIGVFPIVAAGGGNIAGYEATKTRRFCGSCHVMTPYANDSEDPESTSLAARHARNDAFGHENCYACHADYGMFGTFTTKIGGLRHVYEYTFNFHQLSLEEALPRIHIRRPFQNASCTRCHSTRGISWNEVGDHASMVEELRDGRVGCASEGCHGPAHPFSKPSHAKAEGAGEGDAP